jgi:DNA-binding Lrp family transcriptional regulator
LHVIVDHRCHSRKRHRGKRSNLPRLVPFGGTVLNIVPRDVDELDARLIAELADAPRAPVLDLARRLGVARGTVQARLDKLQQRGVITGFGPDLSARALGYGVLAFTTIEITQGRLADVVAHLREIPEVLEAHATTGPGDLHCRLVARSNEHLQDVINRVLEVGGIARTETHVALSEQISLRLVPLASRAAQGR